MCKIESILLSVVVAGLFTGCSDADVQQPEQAPQTAATEQEHVTEYRVDLVADAWLRDVVDLSRGGTAREVRISWGDHERSWELDADTRTDDLLEKEEELLGWLVTQFDPDDELEGPVYTELAADLAELRAMDDAPVSSVTFVGQEPPLALLDSGLVAEVVRVELVVEPDHVDPTAAAAAITDYTGDGTTTPAGGTSTIGKTGSLQKFWLDEAAKGAMSDFEDGLEVETWSKSKDWVVCTSDGASTNMPWWYYDTEILDGDTWRNCAIGTLDTEHMDTWKLYWAWIPFSTYKKKKNPTHVVAYQKMSWCWYTVSWWTCEAARSLCMCADETERAVLYRYKDMGGAELEWFKD